MTNKPSHGSYEILTNPNFRGFYLFSNQMKKIIQLDGQHGGGQILRSALSLSMITGTPFRIKNIRGRRPKPGLMRQHLTCVTAAAEISSATVDGAELHSTELVFRPGAVKPGDYTFRIGTAGSSTLLFQTLLPALMLSNQKSTAELHGGTHNPMAPSADFIDRSFLPQLREMGVATDFQCLRYGFAPAGGGIIHATIQPTEKLNPLTILERGKEINQHVECLLGNIHHKVGKNEIATVKKAFDWSDDCYHIKETDNLDGSGNALSLEVAFQHTTLHITALGKFGKSAGKVASDGVKTVQTFLKSSAAVSTHLADQLILPLSLATHQTGQKSQIKTVALTNHLKTNIQIIEQFLSVSFELDETTPGGLIISIYSQLQ